MIYIFSNYEASELNSIDIACSCREIFNRAVFGGVRRSETGDGRGWYFRPLLLFTGLMSEIRHLNINHLLWLTGSISSVIFLCCKVPGDYLNQWCFIVNVTLMNNFIESFIFVEMEAFENNSTWCRILCLGHNVCCPHKFHISVLKSTDFVGKLSYFINLMSKLGSLSTQLTLHNNNIILSQNDVALSFWRNNDVIIAMFSCHR